MGGYKEGKGRSEHGVRMEKKGKRKKNGKYLKIQLNVLFY